MLERERSDLRQKLQAQEAECADARNAVSDARAALESERHTSAQLRQELQTVKQQLSMSRSDLEANSNRVADIVQQFGSLDSVRRGMADAEVQLQHHKQVIKDLTTRLEAALSGRAAAEVRNALTTHLYVRQAFHDVVVCCEGTSGSPDRGPGSSAIAFVISW